MYVNDYCILSHKSILLPVPRASSALIKKVVCCVLRSVTWGILEIAKTVKIEMIIENSIIMFPFAKYKFKDFSGKTPQYVFRILFEILRALFLLETRILRSDYL